ncbi:hypothetical protein [Roseovarius sp. D22-M7]|uniref:hypothetical protein n=1 Tax=Roseovarius sp. D22-M7 TaxID=3127116 RepID=UPI00301000E1
MCAEIGTAPGTYRFILAEFDTGPLADDISALAGIPAPAARRVAFGRLYDGSYTVESLTMTANGKAPPVA